MWQAIFDLVKNISEVLLSSLPNFWKISKNFIDGKYKKVGARFHRGRSVLDLVFVLQFSPRRQETGEARLNAVPWCLIVSDSTFH